MCGKELKRRTIVVAAKPKRGKKKAFKAILKGKVAKPEKKLAPGNPAPLANDAAFVPVPNIVNQVPVAIDAVPAFEPNMVNEVPLSVKTRRNSHSRSRREDRLSLTESEEAKIKAVQAASKNVAADNSKSPFSSHKSRFFASEPSSPRNLEVDAELGGMDVEHPDLVNPAGNRPLIPRIQANAQPANPNILVIAAPDRPTIRLDLQKKIHTKERILDVLEALAACSPQERVAVKLPFDIIDLTADEKNGILGKLRELCVTYQIYVYPQTKKGPSFNYYAGIIGGNYYAFPDNQLLDPGVRFGKACKAELIQELLTVVSLPLGFTIHDAPPKRILFNMLHWEKPNSYVFAHEMRAIANLGEDDGEIWIPPSCSRFIRFDRMKMDRLRRRAEENDVPDRDKLIRKYRRNHAEALYCVEDIARSSRRLASLISNQPGLGILLTPNIRDSLKTLSLLK